MKYDYDLFVIGAGSGGVRASRIAAGLGANVAVAEDMFLGGTCVNVGCVPKKLYSYAAHFHEEFQAAQGFGWNVASPEFQLSALRENKSQEIHRLNGIYASLLSNAGVSLIEGRAEIIAPHQVRVADKTYSAENILIACGGWPRKPRFVGAEHVVNSNDIFAMDALPSSIMVQGGGYIAVEFASIFNGLGCETELVYRGDLFLKAFDEDVRHFVAEELRKKGVKLTFNENIEAVKPVSNGRLSVELSSGETRSVATVMSAIGREPKVQGLGLENTKVTTSPSGAIVVDENFRTQEPSIFAVGDVIGRKELTPVALAEGQALARYLFSKEPIAVDYNNIATAVFCHPNIGTVGLTEGEALSAGHDVAVFESQFRALKHTLSGSDEKTYIKLIVDSEKDRLLGAHMVGADAGEAIQGIAVAMNCGVLKKDLDRTIGIHPTVAEELVTMRTPRAS